MGLLKDAVASASIINGPPCSIASLRTTLPAEVLAEFDELLAGTTYSTTIADCMTKIGYPVKSATLQRHRRHVCECDKRG